MSLQAMSDQFGTAFRLENMISGLTRHASLDAVEQALITLAQNSDGVLEAVAEDRQDKIRDVLTGLGADISQSLSAWQGYEASGDTAQRDLAIDVSTRALATVRGFVTQSDAEKTALWGGLVATLATRVKIIEDMQDRAFSAEFKPEIRAALRDLKAAKTEYAKAFANQFKVQVSKLNYQHVQLDDTKVVSKVKSVEFSFAPVTAEAGAGSTTLSYQLDKVRKKLFGIGYPDRQGEVATDRFLKWADKTGLAEQVVAKTLAIRDAEFRDAGGAELDTLIKTLTAATSGAWLQGNDGAADDVLHSTNARNPGRSDVLDGYDGNDLLTGGRGGDVLRGGGGNDVLSGERGHDLLRGGAGSDILDGGAGNDVLDGGAGSDWVSYALAKSSVTVSLGRATAQDTGHGQDVIRDVENALGSDFGDVLYGSDAPNTLTGGKGTDRLLGRAGNDVLNGGAGQDELTGGRGKDRLKGGAGADSFVFGKRDGTDRVQDFQDGEDKIVVDINGATFEAVKIVGRGAHTKLLLPGATVILERTDPGVIDAEDFLFL